MQIAATRPQCVHHIDIDAISRLHTQQAHALTMIIGRRPTLSIIGGNNKPARNFTTPKHNVISAAVGCDKPTDCSNEVEYVMIICKVYEKYQQTNDT
jgi:hypothetical protein